MTPKPMPVAWIPDKIPLFKSRPIISREGLELIMDFEGFFPRAYIDPVGVPTIGFGRIKGVTREDVLRGRICTLEQAYAWLFEDLEAEAAKYVWAFLLKPYALEMHEWSALVSFTYNRGAGRFDEKLDDLLDVALDDYKLNSSEIDRIGSTILEYNYSGRGNTKKKLLGLVRRRHAEREMFMNGDWRKFCRPGWQKHLILAQSKQLARRLVA